MSIEHGKIEGDYEVLEDLQLYGMITGNAVVKKRATLELFGRIAKNLTVERGAKVVIKGTVSGDVINQGGTVEIYGIVRGNVNGPANIDKEAVIKGTINP